MAFRDLQAEMVSFQGFNGDRGEAYYARPRSDGPFPGVVVLHHFPGWDEWTAEVTRKLAHGGYAAIAPNLFFRLGDGGAPEVVAQARAQGGMPDDQVMADITGAIKFLRAQPQASGKVGTIGFCSGGRQAYLAACRVAELDAAVDCWGGNVVVDDPTTLPSTQPVMPIELTEQMHCPLLGLFGNEDPNPAPAQVNRIEEALKRYHKDYEFHRYEGAGHAFFAWYRPNYRTEQAQDGWQKVFEFFARRLAVAPARR